MFKELQDVISIKKGALREVWSHENKSTRETRSLCYFKLLKTWNITDFLHKLISKPETINLLQVSLLCHFNRGETLLGLGNGDWGVVRACWLVGWREDEGPFWVWVAQFNGLGGICLRWRTWRKPAGMAGKALLSPKLLCITSAFQTAASFEL